MTPFAWWHRFYRHSHMSANKPAGPTGRMQCAPAPPAKALRSATAGCRFTAGQDQAGEQGRRRQPGRGSAFSAPKIAYAGPAAHTDDTGDEGRRWTGAIPGRLMPRPRLSGRPLCASPAGLFAPAPGRRTRPARPGRRRRAIAIDAVPDSLPGHERSRSARARASHREADHGRTRTSGYSAFRTPR